MSMGQVFLLGYLLGALTAMLVLGIVIAVILCNQFISICNHMIAMIHET